MLPPLLPSARAFGRWTGPAGVRHRRGMPSPPRNGHAPAGPDALTVRELEVLEQLKSGKSTKLIAVALGLSARTVDLHRANIKRKLGLRTGAELIAYASQRLG